MDAVLERKPQRMSLALFRAFVEGRPDEEHWELIDGVAMMMAPPTLVHQLIATNLQHLLHGALQRHAPTLIALPRIGLNLGPAVEDYDPELDVVVIDAELTEKIGERYAGRFYLVAEIVSSSDRPIIENKRAVYKLHDSCKCVLTIQQERFEVRIDSRKTHGWEESKLANPADRLVLADFGLDCSVADLYRGTSLLPRQVRRSSS
jgi:Uma2 family endonuclease